jgi:hypothetical protein
LIRIKSRRPSITVTGTQALLRYSLDYETPDGIGWPDGEEI